MLLVRAKRILVDNDGGRQGVGYYPGTVLQFTTNATTGGTFAVVKLDCEEWFRVVAMTAINDVELLPTTTELQDYLTARRALQGNGQR